MSTFYNPTPTNFYDDYIAHHGILGMKWGKQNGPPYPLGSGDHSKSERSAGWKKSLGGGRNEEMYDRKKKKTSSSTPTNKKPDRHERAANASAKDAEDLRKHGYTKEADAVQKVSDQQRAKSKTANKQDIRTNGFSNDELELYRQKRIDKIKEDGKKYNRSSELIKKHIQYENERDLSNLADLLKMENDAEAYKNSEEYARKESIKKKLNATDVIDFGTSKKGGTLYRYKKDGKEYEYVEYNDGRKETHRIKVK